MPNPKKTNEAIFKKGIIVNSIGIVTKSTKAFFFILISHILGASEFGIFVYCFAIFDVLNISLQFGMGQNLAAEFGRYKLHHQENYVYKTGGKILMLSFFVMSLISVLIYFIAPFAFELFRIDPIYVVTFQILCFGLPFYAIKYIILLSMRASLDTRPEVLMLNLIEPIILIIVSWIALKFNPHVETMTKSLVVAYAYVTLICLWFFKRKFKVSHNMMDPNFRYIAFLKSCFPIFSTEALNAVLGKIDLLLVGIFVSPALVGIYGGAVEIANIILKIRTSIDPTLPSLVQKLHHEQEAAKMQNWFSKSMFWVFFISLLAVGCMALDPTFFMSFFNFEREYQAYFVLAPMISFGRIFPAVTGLIDTPLYMLGKSKETLRISVINFVLSIICFLLLIPKYGVFGAAVGYVIASGITALYRLHIAKTILHIQPINRTFLIPLISGICAFFIARPWTNRIHIPYKISDIFSFILFGSIYYICYLTFLKFQMIRKARV